MVPYLDDDDDEISRAARQTLGRGVPYLPGPESLDFETWLPAISDALGSDDERTSRTARERVQELGPQMFDKLVGMLPLTSEHRFAATRVLGNLGDKRALEPLLDRLAQSDRYETGAEDALGLLGDPRAVDALIGRLSAPYSDPRKQAVVALRRLGETKAIEPLLECLTDEDWFVRQAVVDALDTLGWSPGTDETGAAYWLARRDYAKCAAVGSPAIPVLLDSLTESSFRGEAVDALIDTGDSCLDAAISKLTGDDVTHPVDREQLQFGVARLIKRFGDRGLDRLCEALNQSSGQARYAVMGTLVALGSRRALNAAAELLEGPDHDLAATTAGALARAGDQRGKRWQANESPGDPLASDNPNTAAARVSEMRRIRELFAKPGKMHLGHAALRRIEESGDRTWVSYLLEALDVDPGIGLAAVRLGGETVVPRLIGKLSSRNHHVRGLAAYALGRAETPVAVEPVLELLEREEDDFVRTYAGTCLAMLQEAGIDEARTERVNAALGAQKAREMVSRAMRPTQCPNCGRELQQRHVMMASSEETDYQCDCGAFVYEELRSGKTWAKT